MPYFHVDGKSIYDNLREPKFHLLTFTSHESDYQREWSEIEGSCAPLLDHHVLPLGQSVIEAFGVSKPFIVLLRPDNHIGLISAEPRSSQVVAYLNQPGKMK